MKNKEDILFENEEQKNATDRVLALLRINKIIKENEELLGEIVKYASNIDLVLERNNYYKRYLERVSLDDLTIIYFDTDLQDADFRVKEVIEDLIKRINTRITLIRSNEALINELRETYAINEAEIKSDIDLARLNISDFKE